MVGFPELVLYVLVWKQTIVKKRSGTDRWRKASGSLPGKQLGAGPGPDIIAHRMLPLSGI